MHEISNADWRDARVTWHLTPLSFVGSLGGPRDPFGRLNPGQAEELGLLHNDAFKGRPNLGYMIINKVYNNHQT